MDLRETLGKYTGGRVKIGSSSSFIYCGPVNDAIYWALEQASKTELEKKLNALEKSARRRDANFDIFWAAKLNDGLQKIRAEAKAQKLTPLQTEKKMAEFIDKTAKMKARDRERVDKQLSTVPDRIKNWKPFLDRRVKEEYESIEGGTIIIIEGHEVGDFWTYEEYERRCENGVEIDILQAQG